MQAPVKKEHRIIDHRQNKSALARHQTEEQMEAGDKTRPSNQLSVRWMMLSAAIA